MEALKELLQFMQPEQRLDLKVVAVTHVLGLTGTAEGKGVILSLPDMIVALFKLTSDQNIPLAKDATFCIINLTADESDAVKVFELAKQNKYGIISQSLKYITDENSVLADPWSMILSNLTRVEMLVHEIMNELTTNGEILLHLTKAFTRLNNKNGKLHYLASVFCNLTQTSRGRELFCDSTKYNLLDKVLPFVNYDESIIRRGGVIGILKNICFDNVYHDIILNDKDDILTSILYPLCGPEEYTDEEYEKFPIGLQYLSETKIREEDPDLRKILLESLLQLCATKRFRESLRSKGVYEILREYHKWEAQTGKDKECLLACENVVDILIKQEHEIGLNNYKDVEIPHDVAEKFVKEDAEYLQDLL